MYEALYEYAYISCEWEGIDPYKAPEYVNKCMAHKAREISLAMRTHYLKYPTVHVHLNKHLKNLALWEDVVRKEHGGGKPLGYLHDGTESIEYDRRSGDLGE
jgi:hypothetical protein